MTGKYVANCYATPTIADPVGKVFQIFFFLVKRLQYGIDSMYSGIFWVLLAGIVAFIYCLNYHGTSLLHEKYLG